jgi:DUF4097 and DUF4098 domain-containing protein YvlB
MVQARANRDRVAVALVLVALAATAAAGAEFDRTIPVPRGTTFDLRLFGGEITVHAWNRDAVRVRATHFRTDLIDVTLEGEVLRVSARSRQGLPHAIDFQIDVPEWLPLSMAGTYLDISVEGVQASVTAETVRGDIRVKGGVGVIVLKSVEGEIVLEGASGRADVTSVNNGVRISDHRGDVAVDTISGHVKLQNVSGPSVDVSTTSGDISWDGTLQPTGHYQFATHAGDVDVTLDDRADVTVSVRAFGGPFSSAFSVPLPDEAARRKRFGFVLGAGHASMDLESFSGAITLRRATPAPPR